MGNLNIFTTSIFLNTFDKQEFKDEIYKELKTEQKKNHFVKKSNIGGFQTENLKNSVIENYIIKNSFALLNDKYTTLHATEVSIKNFWINVNYKNSWNVPHVHPNSNFSGVFYLETPEDSGNLIFLRNDGVSFTLPPQNVFESDTDFHETFLVKPKENMFVVFPSHLNHMVEANTNDLPRISLSFNLSIEAFPDISTNDGKKI